MYYLADHVFFCRTLGYYIFLDVVRNVYFTLQANDGDRLGRYVHGWHSPEHSIEAGDPPLDVREAIFRLVEHDVLRLSSDRTKPARATEHVSPISDISHIYEDHAAIPPTKSHLTRFFARSALIHVLLEHRPFRNLVARIVHRKATAAPLGSSFDIPSIQPLLVQFNTYRPYFPRKYLCLYDSLALVEFLAAHGLFPTLVFGVRDDPFYAHCWVQHGTTVLNDYFDRVGSYVPIMAI